MTELRQENKAPGNDLTLHTLGSVLRSERGEKQKSDRYQETAQEVDILSVFGGMEQETA